MELSPSTVTHAEPAPEGFWPSVRAALRGTHQDFTEGSIGRAIALLAIPMVIEMAMESTFALVDVFFVSRLGPAAVAALGLTESMMTLVYTVSLGLSTAATATVARRIGEKNPAEASRATAQALWLGLAISVPISCVGGFFAPDLLRLMGADETVVRTGASFTRLALGGNATVLLLFVLNGVFRGAGDAATAMRSLVLANGINVILNPCFIFGLGPFPELGLLGSSMATNIGRGVGVLYQLHILFRGQGRLRLDRGSARIDPALLLRMLRLALGGAGQMFILTTSWIGLMRITAWFGAAALAGYTVAIRIVMVVLLPAWGMSNAAATLVGQNLGAGKPDRAESSAWRTGFYSMIFLALVTVTFLAFAEEIVSPFLKEETSVRYAADCLRIISYGYIFYAYGMVMMQAFNGAGDTTTPTLIYVLCFWMFQLPLAYVLASVLGYGPRGVFISITAAEAVSAVVSVLVFRRGSWKLRRV